MNGPARSSRTDEELSRRSTHRELHRQSELTRVLASLQGFPSPRRELEQVATPAEQASRLLWEARAHGDLVDRSVLDLGCGTGTLALGAALLGASRVRGVDADEAALEIARANAAQVRVAVEWSRAELGTEGGPDGSGWACDTVVMNPPFGAQRAHADRPFLEAAARALEAGGGAGAIYCFANAASQAFIERWAMARRLSIEGHERSSWPLPPTFPHHRELRGRIDVDRWVLRRRKGA